MCDKPRLAAVEKTINAVDDAHEPTRYCREGVCQVCKVIDAVNAAIQTPLHDNTDVTCEWMPELGELRRITRDGWVDDGPCRCKGAPAAENAVPLDPIEPTAITPNLAAIPLTPTPWDDLPDGQHAVTPDGTVWLRRGGLWHRDPWCQGEDAEQIIAICESPDDWAYGLDWTRKQVEEAVGPLTAITLPPTPPARTEANHG